MSKCTVRMSVVLAIALVVSVFGGGVSLVSAQTSDRASDGEVRIWAQKLDSGNVEFGLRVDSRGGVDVSFTNRFLVYGAAEAGVWYASESKLVVLGDSEASPQAVLRILARRLDSGNVEFGLRVDSDKTRLPDARYFPYSSSTVGSRLYSSRLVVSPPGSASPDAVDEGRCLNGITVPNPLANPKLVSDCESLLEALDTMLGGADIRLADEPWRPVGNTPPLWSVNRDLTVTSDSKISGWSYVESTKQGTVLTEEGARVDPITNRVSWVEFRSRLGASGVVPASFGNLDELTHLVMVLYPLIEGPIPDSWANLTKLEKLRLATISLSGSIPSWIGTLTSLRELELSGSSTELSDGLTGAIPSSIADLSNLEVLHLSRNSLTGEIPAFLGGLSSLKSLYLDDNDLSGSIPSELGDLSDLVYLNLSNNDLSGSIPSELGNLNLYYLDLRGNDQLTGCVPASLKTYAHELRDGSVVQRPAQIYIGVAWDIRTLQPDSSSWCTS